MSSSKTSHGSTSESGSGIADENGDSAPTVVERFLAANHVLDIDAMFRDRRGCGLVVSHRAPWRP